MSVRRASAKNSTVRFFLMQNVAKLRNDSARLFLREKRFCNATRNGAKSIGLIIVRRIAIYRALRKWELMAEAITTRIFIITVSTLLNCERRIIAGNARDAVTHDDREKTAIIGRCGRWSGV